MLQVRPFGRLVRRSIIESTLLNSTTYNKRLLSSTTNSRRGKESTSEQLQSQCDVLIIGGGGVGSSCAYWLKRKVRDGLNVVVVEKDSAYKKASTVLSVGGVRQQFSLPENIQMSLYGAEFMDSVKEHLGDVALNFVPNGYLVLASEEGAENLNNNSKLQNELGARNEILTPEKLKLKFPWICTDGVGLGCYGFEKEGWFDPWALLMGYKNKAREFGANFIDGEVIDFEFKKQSQHIEDLDKAVVRLSSGEEQSIKFDRCVIAAGPGSGHVGRLARLGNGPGLLSTALPVEPRKRYVYVFDCQGENAPGLMTPLTIDSNGTYFRRDGLGGNYLGGRSPNGTNEPSTDNLDVDHSFFEEEVWPTLAQRVKAFESVKVRSSWAGYYEFNTFDENGIIGQHPQYKNLYIATGFSGHGIQQTPAVGRAISELIIDGRFTTIDLTRLGFTRIINGQRMPEVHIY